LKIWPVRFLVLFVAAMAVGCATAVVTPTSEDLQWASARWPKTTMDDLLRARTLYIARCAGCHNLHRPEEYSPDRWRTLVVEMRSEAKITPEEEELIVEYLSAASTRLRNVSSKDRAIDAGSSK
jgi:hypothetical protein